MLRIAALAPWAPETSPETAVKSAATGTHTQPVIPPPAPEGGRGAHEDGHSGQAAEAGHAAQTPGDGSHETARGERTDEHDPCGAHAGADDSGGTGDGDEESEAGASSVADTAALEGSGEVAGSDDPDSAADHFRQGAHLLRASFQESVGDLHGQVSDSVHNLHDRLQRHRPEAVGQLLTSIRDSTDTLGLTSTGKHGSGGSVAVIVAVVAGVLVLLGVVLWALLFRT